MDINNYSPLAKEYLTRYYFGLFQYDYNITADTIKTLDELNLLPKTDVHYITNVFSIVELELICYRKSYPFNSEYCKTIDNIINKTKRNKRFIEDNDLMEYIKVSLNMQYGFERYISESKDFRTFIYDLASKYNYKVYDFKKIIDMMLNYLTAYAYYCEIDKDIVRKLSIIFMCNYEKVTDTLLINGFDIRNINLDNNYFESLIKLIQKCSSLDDDKGKVIS